MNKDKENEVRDELDEQLDKLYKMLNYSEDEVINNTVLINKFIFDLTGTSSFHEYKHNGRSFWFFMFDLNNYKYINDKLGHLAGDNILKTIARNMRSQIGDYDILGRFGGDEFYLFSVETDKEKLKELFNPEDYIINSHDYTIPVFNVSFKNISGEYIVSELDKKDIYVSTGSACTSGDLAPSYVLEAINCPSEYIQGTIRISFDPMENTIDEINMVFHELQKIIKN